MNVDDLMADGGPAKMIEGAWRSPWDKARMSLWVQVLGDIPAAEVRATVADMVRTPAQFAPTPGQVRARILAHRQEHAARTCREPKRVCETCKGTGWEYVTDARGRECVRRCACDPNIPTEKAPARGDARPFEHAAPHRKDVDG